MRFFKTDIKRALTEPTFLLAVLIGGAMAVFSLIYYSYIGIEGYNGDLLFQKTQQLLLPFFAPVIAAIPYANMNTLEEDTGYQRLLYLRTSSKGYLYKRSITVALIGGFTILVPVFLLYIISLIISLLYGDSKVLYELSYVLFFDFAFGAGYAMLSYSITFYCTRRYLPVIIPQVFYMLFTYAVPYLGLQVFYPPRAFTPWIIPDKSINTPVWYTLVLVFILAFILLLFESVRSHQRKGR